MPISERELKKICHPRETIKEAIRVYGVELIDFKTDRKKLRKFLAGKGKITRDMAKEFGRVFSCGSQFFINLQKNYDEKHYKRFLETE